MKTKTLKKLIKDYQLVFTNLGFKINADFKKDYLHIKRMQSNSTQISFIKADKIEGLEKNVPDFKLKPNDTEQREKYFTAVRPSKFLASMIVQDNDKASLFSQISEQFNKDFINNIKSKLTLYKGDDIGKIYNLVSAVGCMSRSPISWFKVYAKTENLQLATLQEGETVLMRSLLWYDKESNNYWLDNSYEQSAINGDNTIRKEYQKKLICQVIDHIKKVDSKYESKLKNFAGFGCNFASSLDSEVVQEIEKEYKIKIFRGVKRFIDTVTQTDTDGKETQIETGSSKECILLKPIIKDFDADDFDSFPYSDTFRSIGRNSGKWFLDSNNGHNAFICLQSTEGEDENNSGAICDCCSERIQEDEINYSDIEAEYLCEDCIVYIDERDDTCRRDNAVYNNYTNEYHYCNDLDR